MLAACTARTNAYAQALAGCGIRLSATVLFGDERNLKAVASPAAPKPGSVWDGAPVLMPDLCIPLRDSLARITDTVHEVEVADVNDHSLLETMKTLRPKVVIYSGYGSQIVGPDLIRMGPPIIHSHAGWLPDFRGSTTTYYHLLAMNRCAVSVLILNMHIDTGDIVSRRWYPPPPAGVDIDYSYDCAIRADLMCRVIHDYESTGTFPPTIRQESDEGNVYYVIHPVLKHIAMLSLYVGLTDRPGAGL